jgi:hypothetical protein
MKNTELSFDLYCHWGEREPAYRVYIDNDLITERTFDWPGFQIFIREHIVVAVEPGKHLIKVENLNPECSKFEIKNVKVNQKPSAVEFIVD